MMTMMRTAIDNDDDNNYEDYFDYEYVCRLWYCEMTIIMKIIKIKEITMMMF